MLDMLFSQSVNGPDFPVRSVSRSKTCKQGNDAWWEIENSIAEQLHLILWKKFPCGFLIASTKMNWNSTSTRTFSRPSEMNNCRYVLVSRKIRGRIILCTYISPLFQPFFPQGSRVAQRLRALASHQCSPSLNPGVDAICPVSLLLVLSFARRGFFCVLQFSPLLKNQHSKF